MQEQQLIEWIQLINSPKVGPVRFTDLMRKYKTAKEALSALAHQQEICSERDAVAEIEEARRKNIHIITKEDPEYPKTFLELHDIPPLLYARGNIKLLNYPSCVAVVGSRNASIGGRKMASKIAFDLTENDVLIVSGMARGIDASAHKGALYAKEQSGATIAVLGTGVDVPYPLENTDLYEQICAQGVVISEYPLGTQPQPQNFPRRNRLISAFCEGILVAEATLNSGSLITARVALEQGKDVFAIPGSPLDGRSSGTNHLIREGAYLTESSDDVLEALKFTHQKSIKDYIDQDLFDIPLDKPQKNADIRKKSKPSEEVQILTLIPAEGIETDEFIRRSGLEISQAMMQITELEIEGQIDRQGSRLYVKS